MRKQLLVYIVLLFVVLLTGCTYRSTKEATETTVISSSSESIISNTSGQTEQSEHPSSINDTEPENIYQWNGLLNYRGFSEWLPNGKYFVRFFDHYINIFNTENELERRTEFPDGISMDDYYPIICNEYFFLFPNKGYEDEYGHSIIWRDNENNYLLSDMLQIDWYGNIIREFPKVQEKKDEQRNRAYYLEGKEVVPVEGTLRWNSDTYRIDDDLILFMPATIDDYVLAFHYIPSENKFYTIEKHYADHFSVKTPIGVIWKDYPNLKLTIGKETKTLYSGIEYFCATDEILVVAFKEENHMYPLCYATFTDMKLKKIDDVDFVPPATEIRANGPYVAYEDYQNNQHGYTVFNSRTGKSWFAEFINEDGWISSLESIQVVDGKPRLIIYHRNQQNKDPEGYYAITKDNRTFLLSTRIGFDLINPQFTYYVDVSDDNSTYEIKPFFNE